MFAEEKNNVNVVIKRLKAIVMNYPGGKPIGYPKIISIDLSILSDPILILNISFDCFNSEILYKKSLLSGKNN